MLTDFLDFDFDNASDVEVAAKIIEMMTLLITDYKSEVKSLTLELEESITDARYVLNMLTNNSNLYPEEKRSVSIGIEALDRYLDILADVRV